MTTFQVSLAASGLPSASYYASLLVDGEAVGKTQSVSVDDETTNLVWEDLILTDSATAEIQVCNAQDDAVVAAATFDLAQIAHSYTKAVGKDTAQGPNVAAHVSEPTHDQLRLVLSAQNLPNTDFATIFNKNQKTDPLFELYNHLGKKVYTSATIENDLNPVWDEQFFSLQDLCGGSLSCPLRITVSDNDGKKGSEYIGAAALSVQQMLDGQNQPLVKGGMPVGKATIVASAAELLPSTKVSRVTQTGLKAALTAVSNLEQLKEQAGELQQAYQAAQTQADEAETVAKEAEEQAETLAAAQAQAEAAYKTKAQEAKALLESPNPFSGQLQIQLSASNLVDTDFGIRNKSDPLFEISYSGTVLVQSERLENNLNPEWNAVDMELNGLDSLDTKLKVQILDKDGGGETTPLGHVELSVNELLHAGDDSMTLQDQPKQSTKGQLKVAAASLQNFCNVQDQGNELKAECEGALQTALDEATQAWSDAQGAASEARAQAADLAAAAVQAKEQSEAAENAVKMAEMVI